MNSSSHRCGRGRLRLQVSREPGDHPAIRRKGVSSYFFEKYEAHSCSFASSIEGLHPITKARTTELRLCRAGMSIALNPVEIPRRESLAERGPGFKTSTGYVP